MTQVTRAGVVLPMILSGNDRLQAHLAIYKVMRARQGDSIRESVAYDTQLAAIFSSDPSLFIETIPNRSPYTALGLSTVEPRGDASVKASHFACASDVEWQNLSSWYGCWLKRLTDPSLNLTTCIEVALKNGVCPTNKELFMEADTLLDSEPWSNEPTKLAVAIKYIPQHDNLTEFRQEHLRRSLKEAVKVIDKSHAREHMILKALDCVDLHLSHGATYIPAKNETGGLLSSGFSQLCNCSVEKRSELVQGRYKALLIKLHEHAADLNMESGNWYRPPLIHAIYGQSLIAATTLVELGCDTSYVRTEKDQHTADIVTFSKDYNGPEFAAVLRESIMLRHINGRLNVEIGTRSQQADLVDQPSAHAVCEGNKATPSRRSRLSL